MTKTNRQKNMEHDQRQQDRVRPKPKEMEFKELEALVNSWIKQRLHEQT
jgi:hypothetical protein